MSERDEKEALEALLELPAGPARDEAIARLDEPARTAATQMLELDNLAWASTHGAPPLNEDPVAAMLGLVPDASFRLDSTAFTQQCSRNGIRPTKLAERLRTRGWHVDAGDLFRWQTSVASDVSPALIRAIAEELAVSPDQLVSAPTAVPSKLDTVASMAAGTKRFGELVQRFALARQISPGMAQTTLRTRMLATVQRGDEPAVEQMLESLEALVRALETD